MKDLLITMPKVETLKKFMTQAIMCNNQLFDRRQRKRWDWNNSYQNWGNTSTKTSSTSSSSVELMQIDTTKFKKLSQTKRERHIKLDLCLYCGNEEIKEKHCASNYPLNEKNKAYKT